MSTASLLTHCSENVSLFFFATGNSRRDPLNSEEMCTYMVTQEGFHTKRTTHTVFSNQHRGAKFKYGFKENRNSILWSETASPVLAQWFNHYGARLTFFRCVIKDRTLASPRRRSVSEWHHKLLASASVTRLFWKECENKSSAAEGLIFHSR